MRTAAKRLIGCVPFALPVALLLPEGGDVPIFDARVYANCIARLATYPSWDGLSCAGHPTHAYMLLTAPLLALSPTSTWLLLTTHLALLLAGLWAFRQIVGQLFPEPELWGERALLTGALALQPVLLGSTLHYNPDLAAFAFALLTFQALLSERIWRAAVLGLLLVFTKEIGILLLASMCGVYLAVTITREPGIVREKLRKIGRFWPLLLPFAIFAFRIVVNRFLGGGTSFVVPPDNPTGTYAIASEFLSVRLLDRAFLSYSAAVLVLHFQWLQALVLASWVALLLGRWLFGQPGFPTGKHGRSTRLAFGLFVAFFIVTTRYRTYSSPRYLLSVYPMMLLATYAATRALGMGPRLRAGFFAIVALGAFVSIRSTVDPVSRRVYGTFSFGEHTMIDATSITNYYDREYGGFGVDQLANNLQFTSIHRLQDRVLRDAPGSGPFVVDRSTRWFMWGATDVAATHRIFALEIPGGPPTVEEIYLPHLLGTPPPRCRYVLYPMYAQIQEPIVKMLGDFYETASRSRVEVDGYRVEVLSLVLDEARWRAWSAIHRGRDSRRL